jgi:hypothetical protein
MASVEKVTTEYVLRLSEDEAHAVLILLDRAGGNSKTSPRRHADTVAEALRAELGIDPDVEDDLATGVVYFHNYDKTNPAH